MSEFKSYNSLSDIEKLKFTLWCAEKAILKSESGVEIEDHKIHDFLYNTPRMVIDYIKAIEAYESNDCGAYTHNIDAVNEPEIFADALNTIYDNYIYSDTGRIMPDFITFGQACMSLLCAAKASHKLYMYVKQAKENPAAYAMISTHGINAIGSNPLLRESYMFALSPVKYDGLYAHVRFNDYCTDSIRRVCGILEVTPVDLLNAYVGDIVENHIAQ